MRVEDIDGPRVVPGSADAICRDHEWLGLDWDEGPVFQSTRDAIYDEALETLREAGLVYPCTCSRKEIAKIDVPEGGIYSVAFHTAGDKIAAAGFDGMIRLYDPATGSLVKAFAPVEVVSKEVAAGE